MKYDLSNKGYMHKKESLHRNKTHRIFRTFGTQMYHPIPTKRPDLVLIRKKQKIVDTSIPADHGVKVGESRKLCKCIDLDKELRLSLSMKVIVIPIGVGALRTVPKNMEKGYVELWIKKKK